MQPIVVQMTVAEFLLGIAVRVESFGGVRGPEAELRLARECRDYATIAAQFEPQGHFFEGLAGSVRPFTEVDASAA